MQLSILDGVMAKFMEKVGATPVTMAFGEVAQAKANIESQLKERSIFDSLKEKVLANDLIVSQIRPKIPELRHFIFLKNAENQFISSSFEAPYHNKSGCKSLFALYESPFLSPLPHFEFFITILYEADTLTHLCLFGVYKRSR